MILYNLITKDNVFILKVSVQYKKEMKERKKRKELELVRKIWEI